MEEWKDGKMEKWNVGMLECWNVGTQMAIRVEKENLEIL
jgi:hypothetical protein